MQRHDYRKTIEGLSLALVVLSLVFDFPLLAIVSAVLLFGLLLDLALIKKFATGWERFAGFIGTGISRAVLAVLYIVFLIPYSFLWRAGNRTSSKYFFCDKKRNSYYLESKRRYDKIFFEKPW